MGPMFSDTRTEVISGGNMFGAVGYLQCNPGQRVVPHNNWWWNMDSPMGLTHHPWVDAVETRQLSSAQEVPHSTVGSKVMATIFWDCKGVLLVDYYHRRQQWLDHTTAKCWQICVMQWRRSGGECWPEVRCCCTIMLWRTCLELHRPLVKDIGFEQLSRPPYSPDLTPSDFYLFRHLKQHLRGTRFFDDDEL